MELDLARIEYDVTAGSPAQLTGAFYDAARNFAGFFRASCCRRSAAETCGSCTKETECPYRTVFGQALSSDPEIVRLHQKPSLPFSLYINGSDGTTSAATVGLVVAGSAVNFTDIFHTALLRMIEAAVSAVFPHAKYSVNVFSLDYDGVRQPLANETLREGLILLSGQHILLNSVHSAAGKLVLESPLRLLHNGSIIHYFDFPTFFRSQLRRCSSLFAYYGSGNPDLDFVRLSAAAQNVTVLEDKIRYTQPLWSPRQNRAGLTGSAECVGLDGPMFALLHLGSYFNAGKGASLGAGHYRFEKM